MTTFDPRIHALRAEHRDAVGPFAAILSILRRAVARADASDGRLRDLERRVVELEQQAKRDG